MTTTSVKRINDVIIDNKQQAVTPMTLLQIATQQDSVDVDKLTKLYDLQKQWEANEAKKDFDRAMSAFRAEVPAIKKTRKAHNSMYAGLAETLAVIQHILSKHGLSHSWRNDQAGGAITVTCIVSHNSGHSEQTSMIAESDKSGSKNSIQAIGSTTTYLQRYTLFSILGLASTDDDDDGSGSSAVDIDQIITLMESAKTLAQLDSAAKHAATLATDAKAKARQVYMQRKEELQEAVK